MSNTHIHKFEGKLKQGYEFENLPEKLKRKFNRFNFDTGYFRNLRNKKREVIQNKIMKFELNSWLNIDEYEKYDYQDLSE